MKFLIFLSLVILLISELFGRRHRRTKHKKNTEETQPCADGTTRKIKMSHEECKTVRGKFFFYPKDNSTICCVPNKQPLAAKAGAAKAGAAKAKAPAPKKGRRMRRRV